MRIDRLQIENFKCFEKLDFDLNPHFTLFVGENGSGKTSVLDALAIAAGVWLVKPPDTSLVGSQRNISSADVRLSTQRGGDRNQFVENLPVLIRASGPLMQASRSETSHWIRTYPRELWTATDPALRRVESFYEFTGFPAFNFPVLAYYGAARAWTTLKNGEGKNNGPARRWAAFRDCLSGRIDFDQLNVWFRRENGARGNRGGRWRPGFGIVLQAVRLCFPEVEDIWFDDDRDEVIVEIAGDSQPLSNLSAGQRMLMAMVADIAIKAVTQNAHLVPADQLNNNDEPLPRVLQLTPGLVLIDELDLHLHPRWQRRVASDLKRTFPAIQFVCTSHSPQIIGELRPDEIRILERRTVSTPGYSFGIDSNRILEELMDSPSRDESTQKLLRQLFHFIDKEDFIAANAALAKVEAVLGAEDPEVIRARTMMSFLQSTI